jgi:curved DNA-binding protein
VKDYYKILGVDRSASPDDIKSQYRRQARKYHPDVSKEEDATAKFQEVQEAYSVLSDEQKKAMYDRGIDPNQPQQQQRRPGGGFNAYTWSSGDDPFMDLNDFFSGLRGRGFQQQRQRQMANIRISLEEAFTGTSRTLNDKPFNIPAGVRTGNQLLVDDFIIIVNVMHHHKFKRANDDLLLSVNITAAEAMIGTKGTFTHIDGTTLQFTIPPGVQPGQVLRLKGKGMPNPEYAVRGDLLIQVSVTIPTNLTDEQKAGILQLGCREEITF